MDRWAEGKTALVTGAGSGIGRSVAMAFAARGAAVAVADLDIDAADATVALIGDGAALAIRCDVSDEAEVHDLIERVAVRFGRIDFAHNNAGIDGNVQARLADQTAESWDRVIAVNLSAVFHCMRYEIPVMVGQGGGSIVNTASVCGLRGFAKAGPYVASKFGVNGLTQAAALDYADAGVRVNSVCPGVIETAMVRRAIDEHPAMIDGLVADTPMRRLGQPREIANTVVWLCSDEASYITGQTFAVDGGFTAK